MSASLVPMWRWFAVFAVALLVGSASEARPGPRPIRVVTFNVLHGGVFSGLWGDGHHLEERIALATEALRALDADVIGLQEASAGRRRGDVAARLASAVGLDHVFAASRLAAGSRLGAILSRLRGFEEGPAILSRFPIRASQVRELRRCGEVYRRVLLCAVVKTPWGPLDVCSTHVDGSACELDDLTDLVRARQRSVPLLLLGDLNATEDVPGVRRLVRETEAIDTFRHVNAADPGCTVWQWVHTARRMASRRVDYVLLAPGSRVSRVVASRVVLDRPGTRADGGVLWPSDHYGVLSEIEISTAG